MLDRRKFLELFAGGLTAAAHGGVPAFLLKPAETVVKNLDADFALPLYGLLVNARVRGDDGMTYSRCD